LVEAPEVDAHRQHRAFADAHALDHFGARADERAVADDHRLRLQRLEHPADPDAAREVHVLADLRARADRYPGVDHRPFVDIGADVDEARHQHHALGDVAAAPRHRARDHAEAGVAEAVLAPAGELARHLVVGRSARGALLDDRIVVEPERQQHRLLEPLVDLPAARAVGLGDARLAAVEQLERRLDRLAHSALAGVTERRSSQAREMALSRSADMLAPLWPRAGVRASAASPEGGSEQGRFGTAVKRRFCIACIRHAAFSGRSPKNEVAMAPTAASGASSSSAPPRCRWGSSRRAAGAAG
jgi:hypothetical protein